jgi:arylsulfatase A-like enzyme
MTSRLAPNGPLASAATGPAVALALWAGLLTGAGELAYFGIRRYVRQLLLFQGSDVHVYWVTPLADALLFALQVGLLALLGRMWPRGFRPAVVVALLAFLFATSMLLLIPPIHPAAVVLLGLGVGVQAGRLYPRVESWIERVVRITLPMGLALVAIVAAGIPIVRRQLAARAEQRLSTAAPGAPNVLLIILDTVRAFDLSLYGYRLPTTPALTRWAAGGVRFEHAFSTAPWTLPSHASILTGREAHELSASWQSALDGTYPTLAEALRDHGYRTGGFVANVAYCSRETGIARGFAAYDDYEVNFDRFVSSASITRRIVDPRWVRRIFWGGDMLGRKPAPVISKAFLDWAGADRTRPFFAFLNYYDAHVPYLPPEPFRSRFKVPGQRLESNLIREPLDTARWSPQQVEGLEAAYDGAISYLDTQIDSLLTTLDRQGVLENTLVIITADHGEEFNEHGVILHGNSLYRPSVEVPLILRLPGKVPRGVVATAPASPREIPATVLDLLGITDHPFPGPSLQALWGDSSGTPPTAPIYSSVRRAWGLPAWYPVVNGDMISVADGGFRLIRGGGGREELYDQRTDPFERTNLFGQPGTEAETLRLSRLLDQATGAATP